jgi:hypothetical protein
LNIERAIQQTSSVNKYHTIWSAQLCHCLRAHAANKIERAREASCMTDIGDERASDANFTSEDLRFYYTIRKQQGLIITVQRAWKSGIRWK